MRNRPNLVLAIVAALVTVMAIVAWTVSAMRKPPELDLTTPAGTVQAYIAALAANDDESAVALLDPKLGCKAPLPEQYLTGRVSASLTSSKEADGRATVAFDVTQYGDAPFDSWSQREVFELVRTDSGWLITGEPWPIYSCE